MGKKDKTPYVVELAASASRLNDVFKSLGDYVQAPDIAGLHDVMSGGSEFKKTFEAVAEKEMAGVFFPVLKQKKEQELNLLRDSLHVLIGRARNWKGSLIDFVPDDLIELHDGRVRFSAKANDLIDKHCEVYIETEDQAEVYRISCAFADLLNGFNPYIEKYCYDHPLEIVSKSTTGKWAVNNDCLIDMPDRLERIAERDRTYSRRQT